MTVYAVGQSHPAWRPGAPEGLHILGLSAERQEVMVLFHALTDAEVQDFRRGPFDVAFAAVQDLGVLLVRCAGSKGWMDAGWDLRRFPPAERTSLPAAPVLVTWFLLDADTGVIRAMRHATLSAALAGYIGEVGAQQLARPFDPDRYARVAAEYLSRTAEQLLHRSRVIERLGAEDPPAARSGGGTAGVLRARYPGIDARVADVLAALITSGEGRIEVRGDVHWWVDPGFGPDTPVAQLGYDEALGMVDRRQFPAPGQA